MHHTHAVDHHRELLQASSAAAATCAWNSNAVAETVPKNTQKNISDELQQQPNELSRR